MATDLSFVEYVRDQMQGAGQVTFRKMFGEAKPHFLLGEELDDQLEIVELIRLTARELPLPAPKKAKPKKAT